MPLLCSSNTPGPQVNPYDFVVDGSQNYDMKVHGALGNTSILNRYMLDVVIVLWLVDEELMDGLGILIWFHFELFLKLQAKCWVLLFAGACSYSMGLFWRKQVLVSPFAAFYLLPCSHEGKR